MYDMVEPTSVRVAQLRTRDLWSGAGRELASVSPCAVLALPKAYGERIAHPAYSTLRQALYLYQFIVINFTPNSVYSLQR